MPNSKKNSPPRTALWVRSSWSARPRCNAIAVTCRDVQKAFVSNTSFLDSIQPTSPTQAFILFHGIIIGAHSADALADAIDWLLERCAELRLTLSCRKSTIGTHAMKVLGKMVKYHSIEPTAERIAAIRDYSQPTTVGELRSFLGMMAQIASHVLIHKIAEINLLHTAASNLHTSVSNVEWTPELSAAFNVVKDTASKPETLVPFDETRQVFLLCDASDDGYGAWLCHLAPDTNRLQPIDNFSGAWTAAQRNYTVPEKEAADLRLCCERWRYELLGRTTIVLCDNNAVVQLLANVGMAQVRVGAVVPVRRSPTSLRAARRCAPAQPHRGHGRRDRCHRSGEATTR
jgi:hypothetical protein